MYWKLGESNDYIEWDYPRDMSIWRGVPVPVDAAFQYFDGQFVSVIFTIDAHTRIYVYN